MKAPNHIVGGFATTGTCASLFFGINILSEPELIVATLIGSLIADIDHPSAIMGRIFFFISKPINRYYGHRTVTHGIPIILMCCFGIGLIEYFIFDQTIFAKVFCIAWIWHCLLDTMTVSGVKLFYPFMTNKSFVIVEREEWLMRTGDARAETIWMIVFIALNFFLAPLREDGFWTTWNKSFGTLYNLDLEFKGSEDLLSVKYIYKVGSEKFKGVAYAIETSGSRAVLLDSLGRWKILDETKMIIEDVNPTHTEKRFTLNSEMFINISVDSLNKLLRTHNVREIQAQANEKFIIQKGVIKEEKKALHEKYVNGLTISEIKEVIETEEFKADYSHAPRIATLRADIERVKKRYSTALEKYELAQYEAAQAKEEFKIADIARQDQILKELKELEKVQNPKSEKLEVQKIETQIQQIQNEKAIDNQSEKERIDAQNQEAEKNISETKLTGVIKFVKIDDQ